MSETSYDTVASRLQAVRMRIANAAKAASRPAESVTLVAVSKTHDASAVATAIAAGQLAFGENRVQEAEGKFPGLKAMHPGLQLHLIGPLQTNKVAQALQIADVVETLDRPRLADAIAAAHARGSKLPRLLIQVNVGKEPQKAGIMPDEADRFIQDCQERFGAAVAGLMCIPPAGQDPAPFFDALAERAARHRLSTLSMGMSEDFEIAIRHGATHVRVGTALFGARPQP